jgi:soluble lytic murein transglycosylase
MDYDAGKLEDAEAGLAAYVAAHPSGTFVADARWFRAWAAYRRGDTSTAVARFDEVVAKHASSDLAVAARYWKARATDDAVALRALLRDKPDTGYAFFAAERLGVKFPAPAAAPTPTLPDSFVATRPSLALGVRLAEAGFADWARPLLKPYVAEAKSAGEATALGLARLLVAVEDYRAAKALASAWCATPAARSVCVPRPHVEAVTAVAARNGLPPLLPYAIMNAESGLDPSVTSPAGARGLMQLMPELAVKLAADDLPGFVVDDLYRAGVNARLGTSELGLLHARFDGRGIRPSLPLVIAGYNGGGDAVARWVDGYATAPDADRFAEDVSFTETRRYVRRVLGFLMQYRRTYGDPA